MAAYGRPTLRDLFDESPTPHIAHPPRTHHRDFYVATDGSFRGSGGDAATGLDARGGTSADGGLGVVIETRDGERVARLSVPHSVPNNNVAEYRALHLGLDVLAERVPDDARVGLLIDHDDLAGNVNQAVLASRGADWQAGQRVSLPHGTHNHWRGIRARIIGFEELRAARISSDVNPAHPLANAPDEYQHVNDEPDRCVIPTSPTDKQVPPPSRSDRGASD